jgi:hypothetical protein
MRTVEGNEPYSKTSLGLEGKAQNIQAIYCFGRRAPHHRPIAPLGVDVELHPLGNEQRPHQGRWCFGKTPLQTFRDAMPMTKEKMIAA